MHFQEEIESKFIIKVLIDPYHKCHNAPDPYPTMHHFVTEMCTYVHISVTKWCIVGCLSDALWDLWNGSIDNMADWIQLMAWHQIDEK